MNIKLIKNILVNKKPFDKTKKIEFLNPKNDKKYINDFLSYSLESNFYDFLESEQPTRKELLNYYKQLIVKDVKKKSKLIEQKSWLIKSVDENVIIGSAKLCDFSSKRMSLQWGYGISKKYRNRNFLLKIQLSLITYVFDQLKFNRIWGQTYLSNKNVINSQKILRFRDEGVKYQFFFDNKKKKFVDAYSYSFLKEDYFKLLDNNKKKNKFINYVEIRDESKTLKEINNTICKVLSIKNNFKNNIQMKDVPNWDSLNHFNIISVIEKKYKKNLVLINYSN